MSERLLKNFFKKPKKKKSELRRNGKTSYEKNPFILFTYYGTNCKDKAPLNKLFGCLVIEAKCSLHTHTATLRAFSYSKLSDSLVC